MYKPRSRRKKKFNQPASQQKGVRQSYVLSELDKTNNAFTDYYKQQGIIPDDQFDAFVAALRTDLPTSFRIQGCYKDTEAFVEMMTKRYIEPMKNCAVPDVNAPERLPWIPGAFQMNMSRTELRSHPVLKGFHNFLVTEADIGIVSRQEAVSMIPPLLLDVKPHHKVLDICAAPGSKTMQIIEMMHDGTDNPEGFIVANDFDNQRCYLLVRQALKRMPSANCVVINEDAAFLPTLIADKDLPQPLLFDRVLCDVVCSGDGTFRKNPDLWREWQPQKALALHKLQLRIATRSAQMLDVNGLMVYSTCSLNPLEDEAVVAALLRYGNGSIELVDVSDQLPELKRSPGISTWKVFDKDLKQYNSSEDIDNSAKTSLVPSMFPPSQDEADNFRLSRCFRILPHVQNTGGFFIAVLRKVHPFQANVQSVLRCRAPPTKRHRCFKEDPFVFLTEGDERWKSIAEHYGVLDTFKHQNLFGRTVQAEKKRTLYYVNDAVKNFLLCNESKVKVINAGVRMFGRVECKFKDCRFRLAQDGVRVMRPFLTKRVVETDVEDMCNVLKSDDNGGGFPRAELHCAEKLKKLSYGSVVLYTKHNNVERVMCTWLGSTSLSPYINKEERLHVLRMFGCETGDLANDVLSKRQVKAIRERKMASDEGTMEPCESKALDETNPSTDSVSESGDSDED